MIYCFYICFFQILPNSWGIYATYVLSFVDAKKTAALIVVKKRIMVANIGKPKHTLNVDKEARELPCANLGQRWTFDHLRKIFQTCSTLQS